jgi:hypothetical protein
MRWDYTQPDKVYYVSDGDILWSYEVATDGVVYKMGVRDSELYDSLKFSGRPRATCAASFQTRLGPAARRPPGRCWR